MNPKYIKASKVITGALLIILAGSAITFGALSLEQRLAFKARNQKSCSTACLDSITTEKTCNATPDIELRAIDDTVYYDIKTNDIYQLCNSDTDIGTVGSIKLCDACLLVPYNVYPDDIVLGTFSTSNYTDISIVIDNDKNVVFRLNGEISSDEEYQQLLSDIGLETDNFITLNNFEGIKENTTYLWLLDQAVDIEWCFEDDIEPISGYVKYDNQIIKFNKQVKDYSIEDFDEDIMNILGHNASMAKILNRDWIL